MTKNARPPAPLATRLAKAREEAGLSQSALARVARTSQSAISQIEAGDRNPSYEMILKISRALDIAPSYLVGGSVEDLEVEEEALLRVYRALPDQGRAELGNFATFLRQKYPSKSEPS